MSKHRINTFANERIGRAELFILACGLVAIGLILLLKLSLNSAIAAPTPQKEASVGLRKTDNGPCKGGYEAVNYSGIIKQEGKSLLCTHPDSRKSLSRSAEDSDGSVPANLTAAYTGDPSFLGYQANWPCIGTGADGARVEAIYAYPAGGTNRAVQYDSFLRDTARRIEGAFELSGKITGQPMFLRFATDPNCNLVINQAALTGEITDYGLVATQLEQQGYNKPNRKYLVWIDADGAYCGQGSWWNNDTPGQENPANTNGGFAMAWGDSSGQTTGCWNLAETHEIMHMLGAVQTTAPHSDGGGHETEDHDRMGGGTIVCPDRALELLFDCNNDDYFYAGTPPLGNYLATHWNTANSRYLTTMAGPPPPMLPSTNPLHLSSITPYYTTYVGNGYGEVQKDRRTSTQPLKLNGVTYDRGLGVHAVSDIRYKLGGGFQFFHANIGVDDSAYQLGSVVFQVWADGTKLYDSSVMTGTSATKSIKLNIKNRQELRLIVTDAGDGIDFDHADWANARLYRR